MFGLNPNSAHAPEDLVFGVLLSYGSLYEFPPYWEKKFRQTPMEMLTALLEVSRWCEPSLSLSC